MEVTTRPIREEELPLIIEYFNEEEWNVSIKSVRALYRYQPEAFNVAVTPEGKVVGDIMGYTVNDKFGFGTGFVVNKNYRNQGIGKKLWQCRWDKMASITWGVDAAPRRLVPNQNLGFCEPECEVMVYRGEPNRSLIEKSPYKPIPSVDIKDLDDSLFPSLVVYDGKMNHAGERPEFLKAWFAMEDLHCVVAVENGKIVGCGEVHPSDKGYAFGHLYADNVAIAFMVMKNLIDKVGWEEPVGMSIPALNDESKALASSFGFEEFYNAHRMWTKPLQTTLNYKNIYVFPEIAP